MTWATCIAGGLSSQAILDFLHLWNVATNTHLSDQPDRLVWQWTAHGDYTAKSAYSMLHLGSTPLRGHKLIWKTWAPLKVKIFLWLAFKRRHWTGDRRRRHSLDAIDLCYLCDQEEETIDHILATCSFSREVWFTILNALGIQLPETAPTTLAWWRRLLVAVTSECRRGMDSLFALVSWHLWKERNVRCFRNATASLNENLHVIRAEAERWIEAGAAGLSSLARG